MSRVTRDLKRDTPRGIIPLDKIGRRIGVARGQVAITLDPISGNNVGNHKCVAKYLFGFGAHAIPGFVFFWSTVLTPLLGNFDGAVSTLTMVAFRNPTPPLLVVARFPGLGCGAHANPSASWLPNSLFTYICLHF